MQDIRSWEAPGNMTIQRTCVTGACPALAQGEYTHRHITVANIVHQEFAIKCGLSKIPPMLYHTYEPQSVLGNSDYNCNMIGP